MKEYIKNVLKLVGDSVSDFFPYLFVFWLICLALAWFTPSWKIYFNWPAFHACVLIFAVISLINSGRIPSLIKGLLSKSNKWHPIWSWRSVGGLVIQLIKKYLVRFPGLMGSCSVFIVKKLKSVSIKNYIKSALILIIAIVAIINHIHFMSLVVLVFAGFSVLLVINSRISAGFALLFLVFCPILLIFDKNGLAEQSAIYAYYFLVITVVAQIAELRYKSDKL